MFNKHHPLPSGNSPACTVNASVNWSSQELEPTIIELFAFCIILSTELCNKSVITSNM